MTPMEIQDTDQLGYEIERKLSEQNSGFESGTDCEPSSDAEADDEADVRRRRTKRNRNDSPEASPSKKIKQTKGVTVE